MVERVLAAEEQLQLENPVVFDRYDTWRSRHLHTPVSKGDVDGANNNDELLDELGLKRNFDWLRDALDGELGRPQSRWVPRV